MTINKMLFNVVLALSLCITVTGCQFLKPTGSQTFPAPVTEHAMTLVWGKDIKSIALHLIQSSRHEVYLDIYELSDEDILHALAGAHQRGVDVRVVVDATEKHSVQLAVPNLESSAVPVRSLRISRGISHIKMLISDGRILMGGMNFGANSWSNNDASVYIPQNKNPSYLSLFRFDWSRAARRPAMAPITTSPLVIDSGIQESVVQAIQEAKRSVDMEAFDLSDRAVVQALDEACKRGLKVSILLDPGQRYSRKPASKLLQDGGNVRYYQPYHGELMHAKILDVDDGATFIIGSANFSHQAYTYNHEGDLVFHQLPLFSQALQGNLRQQLSRGSDSPMNTHTY